MDSLKYYRPSIKNVEMEIKEDQNIVTRTYDVGEGFMVDVVYNPNVKECFQAWLSHKDYVIKRLMFADVKENDEAIMLEEAFLEIVRDMLESEGYIQMYVEEYFKCEYRMLEA